ncbi:MAG: DUF2306 domain-containing protein [Burkholderiaceae bacterium]|nr:MAG: DUF2306 domain-containing protein [Burkholderiaceae bacterium]
MTRRFSRPIPLLLALIVGTFIPVMIAAVRVVQIPLGTVPDDSLRLTSAPVAFFLHSLAGLLFGVLGPLQFVRALRLRFGALHRLAGRVFVLAGAGLALSGLALLLQVESIATGLLDAARGAFGLTLLTALVLGVSAARAHDMSSHRSWMIRAYAIGLGTGPVSLVMFPIYLITGEPPTGLASDLVVVGMWLFTIALGEWIARRPAYSRSRNASHPAPPPQIRACGATAHGSCLGW